MVGGQDTPRAATRSLAARASNLVSSICSGCAEESFFMAVQHDCEELLEAFASTSAAESSN